MVEPGRGAQEADRILEPAVGLLLDEGQAVGGVDRPTREVEPPAISWTKPRHSSLNLTLTRSCLGRFERLNLGVDIWDDGGGDGFSMRWWPKWNSVFSSTS